MTRRRRRRGFPEAVEREAVERGRASGPTIIAVAQELDVRETVLRRRIARRGEPGTTPTKRTATIAAAGGPSPAELAAEDVRPKRELQRA